MHHRVSLHQVAFSSESTTVFLEHCRAIGVRQATLATALLRNPGAVAEARRTISGAGPAVATLNHLFAAQPDLAADTGGAAEGLCSAIDIAVQLGADSIYLLTGGRGSLIWEQAADRFADLIEPCRQRADDAGVSLLVENASPFNADIHIAHTLADTIRLAEHAGIGLCIDIHACWTEAGLSKLTEQAVPMTGLIQVSDYVLGDRSAPCRAVPGDGAIPLTQIISKALDSGYAGSFDIELTGPRIDAEGARAATTRAAQQISNILTNLGA